MYLGEQRREGGAARGVVDWDDGCRYLGTFWGSACHGYGRLRYDAYPASSAREDVVHGCLVEGHFEHNQVGRAAPPSNPRLVPVLQEFLQFCGAK